jgi:SAM-dependent methyltransferase
VPASTEETAYTERLKRLQLVWWKRVLDVQLPYRRHLQSLKLGFVLDLGCGLGRNLLNLGGRGVGVDHNPEAVATARARGVEAYLPEEFLGSPHAREGRFDSLLLSHVAEHMVFEEARALVAKYLPYVADGGRVVFLTPQIAGYRSDPTHVEFFDLDRLRKLASRLRLDVEREYSFPFPLIAGRVFKYNEFTVVARKPVAA